VTRRCGSLRGPARAPRTQARLKHATESSFPAAADSTRPGASSPGRHHSGHASVSAGALRALSLAEHLGSPQGVTVAWRTAASGIGRAGADLHEVRPDTRHAPRLVAERHCRRTGEAAGPCAAVLER